MKHPRKFFDRTLVRPEHRRSYLLASMTFWSLLVWLGLSRFVITSVEVIGQSMTPLLQDGDRRVVHRWSYWRHEPERGDVVMITDPGTRDLAVKRIVGLPGEHVQLRSGMVFVDRAPLQELYLSKRVATWPSKSGIRDFEVPDDMYFVLGDNRLWSADSRLYGPVPEAAIEGKLGN